MALPVPKAPLVLKAPLVPSVQQARKDCQAPLAWRVRTALPAPKAQLVLKALKD